MLSSQRLLGWKPEPIRVQMVSRLAKKTTCHNLPHTSLPQLLYVFSFVLLLKVTCFVVIDGRPKFPIRAISGCGASRRKVARLSMTDAMSSTEQASKAITPGCSVELIFSSGYLCFSRHVGFLRAVDSVPGATKKIQAVVGTSSGALAASLFAAGLSVAAIGLELSSKPPLAECRLSSTPWRGFFSVRALEQRLARVLPATFEELPLPLAVGVYENSPDKPPRLISTGPLPRAVAASCAVPGLFSPVQLGGQHYLDGGAVDRTFTRLWREWKPRGVAVQQRRAIVHIIKNSGDEYVARDGVEPSPDLAIVRIPRAQAKLWTLGNFRGEEEEAYKLASQQLPTDWLSKESDCQ